MALSVGKASVHTLLADDFGSVGQYTNSPSGCVDDAVCVAHIGSAVLGHLSMMEIDETKLLELRGGKTQLKVGSRSGKSGSDARTQ